MPAGRPTVMTPETIAKLEEAYACNCNDLEACLFANISKDSLYRYINKNPEFSDRITQLRSNPRLIAKMNIAKNLKEENVDTAKWVLNHTDKEYKTTLKQEVSLEGDTFKAFLEAISDSKTVKNKADDE